MGAEEVAEAMNVRLLTVGDELLAGDIENTNATWLASELADRGVTVSEIAVLPDERSVVADRVRDFSGRSDAVIVTGGIGGTPDDVTVEAVATAFDRELVVRDAALADVEAHVERIRERVPEINVDIEAEASLPAGSRPLLNPEGLSPGCVLENVYVLPGIPVEMKAMFATVAAEFSGERHTRSFRTDIPESNIAGVLATAREEFGVAVGSYPQARGGEKRITVRGADPARVSSAVAWLETRL